MSRQEVHFLYMMCLDTTRPQHYVVAGGMIFSWYLNSVHMYPDLAPQQSPLELCADMLPHELGCVVMSFTIRLVHFEVD